MIDFEEHLYNDDPKQGHPDVRTDLKDVSYFFLGNGLIQAAVQFAPAGEGTPLGLLIMNPDKLRPKRGALTLHPDTGLENTMIRILTNGRREMIDNSTLSLWWDQNSLFPLVDAKWNTQHFLIRERFYCPDRSAAVLERQVWISNESGSPVECEVKTGVLDRTITRRFTVDATEVVRLVFRYLLDPSKDTVQIELTREPDSAEEAEDYWKGTARISFNNTLLDHYFRAADFQLPAAVSRSGMVDGSIWQYNREWVRDQSFMVAALAMTGHVELARTMVTRLLTQFIGEEGDSVDSSERRGVDEVELDQNGALIYALHSYTVWSGDLEVASKNWEKIKTTVEFPLREVFRHKPSGLLVSGREYYERHKAHGIEPGLESANQLFNIIGLNSAASLARMLTHDGVADHWDSRAGELRDALLNHPRFALHDTRGLIKRRTVGGRIQETAVPTAEALLPSEVPLGAPGEHFLNPDTSTALPIAFDLVETDSPLARTTMQHLEQLWNQAWEGGGYGRYHITSEPDSPGPWPFPSLFIARAYVEMGDLEKAWRVLKWLDTVPGAAAGSWFEFYRRRIAPPAPQVGVIPWTWAEMIILLVYHVLGVRPEEGGLWFRPRLLTGLKRIEGALPLRGGWLNLDIEVAAGVKSPEFKTDAEIIESSDFGILVDYGAKNISIEARLPGG
jgi:hypothetical protein